MKKFIHNTEKSKVLQRNKTRKSVYLHKENNSDLNKR